MHCTPGFHRRIGGPILHAYDARRVDEGGLRMSEPTGAPPPAPDAPGGPPPAAAPAPAAPAPSSWQAPVPAPAVVGPAPGLAYAGLGIRVVALVIDAILLYIVAAILVIALGAILFSTLLNGNTFVALIAGVILAILNMLVSAAYFIWGWTNPAMRASLGQRVMGLNTLNAADGATLTRPQAARRWVFLYGFLAFASAIQLALNATSLAGLASLIGLLAFAYAIFLLWTTYQSPKKQGYHDVQATTVVVKRA
jgi:uncharacterized RDD family membrane protein YckC